MNSRAEKIKGKYLAVIPARGGSKRLPGKNLMEIDGISLIGRAINCVKGLDQISEICVTTDSDSISQEASLHGPYVHFSRPDNLATDEATTIDVVLHAISWFEDAGYSFDAVVLLQPTSPLRERKHIKEAIQLFESKNSAEAVVSVCPMEHPIDWCGSVAPDGSMEDFSDGRRSQDCAQRHRLNGAIYIYDIESLKDRKSFFYSDKTYAYVMDFRDSVDIDTKEDFSLALFWASQK